MEYRLCSFNIRKFSRNSAMHGHNKDSKKDLQTIANIVNDNDIAIIAIQEIMHPTAFKELISAIAYSYVQDITADIREHDFEGGNLETFYERDNYVDCKAGVWQGRWGSPNSKYGTAISEEGYAFIWNTKRVRLPENGRGYYYPRIKHKSEMYFVRPPFFGRFVTSDISPDYEIRLINTHILYTKSAKLKVAMENGIDVDGLFSDDINIRFETERELQGAGYSKSEIVMMRRVIGLGDIERRRAEVNNLISEVVSREEDDKGLSAYTFLVGDYNLNLETYNSKNVTPIYKNKKATINPRTYGIDNKVFHTVQEDLTTLTYPSNMDDENFTKYNSLIGENRYANNYDHFTYNINMDDKQNGRGIDLEKAYRINVIEQYGITNKEYFDRISDHLPIVMGLVIE